MANYTITAPNGKTQVETKGGKVPTFATWAKINGEWKHMGWSYKAEAPKSVLPDFRKNGIETMATPVAAPAATVKVAVIKADGTEAVIDAESVAAARSLAGVVYAVAAL